MITPRMRRRLKRELSVEKPTIWVGKEGVTSQAMNEIGRQLEKREMVKVKLLRSALKEGEALGIASKIAQQTESALIDVRGHTFVLYKARKRGELSINHSKDSMKLSSLEPASL
ncbi:MAG: RNA-binding protein YhbY [Candidatus Bathyarchaeota archaeon BA1]|nr:MAG: RNA-binding protein YhbY [Candidatus Bathyarchaeota archaeon BA1]